MLACPQRWMPYAPESVFPQVVHPTIQRVAQAISNRIVGSEFLYGRTSSAKRKNEMVCVHHEADSLSVLGSKRCRRGEPVCIVVLGGSVNFRLDWRQKEFALMRERAWTLKSAIQLGIPTSKSRIAQETHHPLLSVCR